ncbi:MAG: SMC family ATPase [Christensenellaceae bacterium]|jgi:exonuclease SbcC|nr:SMC family ATPase [Christensenellaceae bacterium]
MRPLKLTLSSFGSFAEKQTIDFELLGKDGLYLITGDTGSGKTTIFDAITFALYGSTSGDNRKSDMLRSKYCKPSDETFVELDFVYHGDVYNIKRNPTYSRSKIRGDGITEEKASAELYMPSGQIITKLSDVNNKISEILGINREQFVQISMIAQGEFLKVLHCSTEERIEIFRKVFYTDLFYKLQIKLKSETSELNKKLNEARNIYKFNIANIQVDAENLSDTEILSSVKSEALLIDDTLEWLKKIIVVDEKNNVETLNKLASLKEEISIVSEKLGRAKNEKTARENLKKAENEYPKISKHLEDAINVLNECESKKSLLNNIRKEIEEIEVSIPKYSQLSNVIYSINLSEKKLNARKKEMDSFESRLEKEKSELENAKIETKILADIEVKYELSRNKEKELNQKKTDITKLKEQYILYSKTVYNFQKAQKDYDKKSIIRDEKLQDFEKANKLYLDSQAGMLATTLQNNAPCPVCGSLHHPNPAIYNQDSISKEQLNDLKKQFETADKTMVTSNLKASQLRGEVQAKKDEITTTADKFGIVDLDEIESIIDCGLDEIESELSILSKQINMQKAKVARKKELDALIDNCESDILLIQETFNKATSDINGLSIQLKMNLEKKHEKEVELKYKDEKEALNKLSELKTKVNSIHDAFENANKEYSKINADFLNITTTIEVLKNQLGNQNSENYDEIYEQKRNYDLLHSEIERKDRLINIRLNANKKAFKAIYDMSDKIKKLENQYKWIKELSDTANGDVAGKGKIKLETYIQTACFDKIIECANVRLLEMTNSQFELVRKNQNSRQGQSGLDLNVIDHYNSTERDVKTLSGGESFIATLALAIGLSDEIQRNSGGIKLDSMFVDEGFDTLDDMRLSQALNCLINLSHQNRIIGIISHVAGLQDKIEKQIKVIKDRFYGSHAEIIIN